MVRMKHAVVVIGDVVGSRRAVDRAGLHTDVAEALRTVNDRWDADLRITVGDEYQGSLPTLGAALTATLWLRLALLPEHDVRHGVGRGARTSLDATTGIEDGPAWWAARAAIDEARARAGRAATRGSRTAYRVADDVDEAVEAVEAALLARDELVGRLDERSLSVLGGLMSGRTQRELADELDVSASAVSQRVRHDAIGVVQTMTTWLETLA